MKTLDKPAGISVFPPHDNPDGDCVLARMSSDWRRFTWPDGFEGGIAHRLDTWTSGALAVAEDPEELERIRAAFREGALVKTYRFLSARNPPWTDNRCDLPLAHDRKKRGRMIVQRGAQTPHRGRWLPASTTFRRLQGALWEARMSTGVMHQIRVHAAFLGIPLRGDRRYGGGSVPEDRFWLHHVGFAGPWKTDPVPLPDWARP